MAAKLTAEGFTVYVPAFGCPETDLIAEWNGRLIRVQVKTLTGEEDSLTYDLRTSSKRLYIGVVDWLALHSLCHGVTAFLKPEAAGNTIQLRYDNTSEPDKHYARDYSMERVIKELSV